MSDTTKSIHQSQQHPVRFRIAYRPATLREKISHWWRNYGWIQEMAVYEAIHFGELGYEKACFEASIVKHDNVFTVDIIR